MIDLLLAASVFCELSAAAAVLLSIRFPVRRIWPPNRLSPWKTGLMGFLFFFPALGIGMLGMLEWGGMGSPEWVRFGLGLPPLAGGLIFFLWAQGVLGFGQMMGKAGALTTGGPFRFSRNPQYAGCLAMLAGWVLLSSSPSAAIVSLIAVIPLVLVPFAEEPWLRMQYGQAYEEYSRKVPRFF
ncbi:MAG: PEMT/PEM2 methyltransferase family protein [Anaerolineales bacterium]